MLSGRVRDSRHSEGDEGAPPGEADARCARRSDDSPQWHQGGAQSGACGHRRVGPLSFRLEARPGAGPKRHRRSSRRRSAASAAPAAVRYGAAARVSSRAVRGRPDGVGRARSRVPAAATHSDCQSRQCHFLSCVRARARGVRCPYRPRQAAVPNSRCCQSEEPSGGAAISCRRHRRYVRDQHQQHRRRAASHRGRSVFVLFDGLLHDEHQARWTLSIDYRPCETSRSHGASS